MSILMYSKRILNYRYTTLGLEVICYHIRIVLAIDNQCIKFCQKHANDLHLTDKFKSKTPNFYVLGAIILMPLTNKHEVCHKGGDAGLAFPCYISTLSVQGCGIIAPKLSKFEIFGMNLSLRVNLVYNSYEI